MEPPSRKTWWWTSKPIKLWPPNLVTFPKNIWEHFKVVVTCASTLMLPWQPSFWSYEFQNLHLFFKNSFWFYFSYYYITLKLALFYQYKVIVTVDEIEAFWSLVWENIGLNIKWQMFSAHFFLGMACSADLFAS